MSFKTKAEDIDLRLPIEIYGDPAESVVTKIRPTLDVRRNIREWKSCMSTFLFSQISPDSLCEADFRKAGFDDEAMMMHCLPFYELISKFYLDILKSQPDKLRQYTNTIVLQVLFVMSLFYKRFWRYLAFSL